MILESVLLTLRHALTAAGAYLTAAGISTSSEIETGAGAVVTLAGLAWSWWRKWKRAAV